MKKIIVGLLLTVLSGPLFCQGKSGYNIPVTISGLRDSSIYLAYHFGDKQYLRDYLVESGWKTSDPPPQLPEVVVTNTRKRYLEALERLTGKGLAT